MALDNRESVKVKTPYWDIAADIYFPPNFDKSEKYPGIVSVHPIGSCKDQTSGNIYGTALADEGFVVIAFDASFQGASGGEPRFIEDPTQRVKDVSHVIDHLVTLAYVDADRIGIIGVCGGGAYSINAATTERRIKAVASITGVNFGRLMHEAFSGYDPIATLEAIAAQRTVEAQGAALKVNNLLPGDPADAEKQGITEIDVVEATEYYRTPRGEKPHGATSSLFSHQATAVGWDAFNRLEVLLTQPVILVVGDKPGAFGAYRDGLEVYRRAASKDKELVVAEGWSHYDLYDKPEPVGIALAALIPFFKKHLGN
ncbi:alpha/beta hydrolase [Mycobacteroides immunogenum]|uniref:Alpha/beta hydrolase n=1 Tax=Mycobacteroides immunogenum TaxID=83262 RepID=A0A7V8LTI7_9MYCO|nr:alpha/beta hydrolase [Mycobacteroides immunogenum]AMT73226.1 alpha/beta hydrolase [Mycobacteroides immunogenum]ANO06385.1 alpha/beta hydrolase [Mycobacteroides immunogenum]KIU37869.1 alpha/beta hydrolase [Mycobacteroides immunogenum]KPG11452.1 alpha/beta hydrolase [Mycobacteroides immunogenum]KPG12060.1 alpha/beta hydrolase [Mycobacteroides immunogenum]